MKKKNLNVNNQTLRGFQPTIRELQACMLISFFDE